MKWKSGDSNEPVYWKIWWFWWFWWFCWIRRFWWIWWFWGIWWICWFWRIWHDDMMTWWHDDMMKWSYDQMIMGLNFSSLKIWLTHWLTRVKSRDSSASKNMAYVGYFMPLDDMPKYDLHLIIWWSSYVHMTMTHCQDHILTENIWFVWYKTSYAGDKMRCYQADEQRTTNKQGKIGLLSLWTVGRLSFAK